MDIKKELDSLITQSAKQMHEIADCVTPTTVNADFEELAKALDALASAFRRIPTIRNLIEGT